MWPCWFVRSAFVLCIAWFAMQARVITVNPQTQPTKLPVLLVFFAVEGIQPCSHVLARLENTARHCQQPIHLVYHVMRDIIVLEILAQNLPAALRRDIHVVKGAQAQQESFVLLVFIVQGGLQLVSVAKHCRDTIVLRELQVQQESFVHLANFAPAE